MIDRPGRTEGSVAGVLGVILAGGRATRMGGGDKCLLPLAGRPILAHVIERLGPQVDALALNANGDPARFAAFGLPVLPDGVPDFAGPLAGVLAGLDWAAEFGAEAIVTAAGDTPFFPPHLAVALRSAAHAADAGLAVSLTPSADGFARHPTFGLWPVDLRADLRAALDGGMPRMVDWTEARRCARAIFHDRGEPFFDVNTPGDLVRAEAMLAASGAA
jgi:molybdopterin-guanine dinucleotide biosynthesis protein A